MTARAVPEDPDPLRMVELLSRAGAACIELKGRPSDFLSALCQQWGWKIDGGTGEPCASSWQPSIEVAATARRESSLRLFLAMGIYREVRRRLAQDGHRDERWYHEITAITLAAGGRYGDAASAWQAALPGNSPQERAEREQHVASCWWREGRLLRTNCPGRWCTRTPTAGAGCGDAARGLTPGTRSRPPDRRHCRRLPC